MTIAEPVVFNPFDPSFRVDPYPVYKRLLEQEPVHQSSFGFVVLSRYDDHVAVLRDHKHWSSDGSNAKDAETQLAALRAILGEEASILDETPLPFLFQDPPDHTRLRGLVNKAFTPRVVENLRPRIQEVVDGLLDAVAGKGSMEVVEELAYPLPVTIICEMLGAPVEDQQKFKDWSREIARSLDPDIVLPPDVLRRRFQAIRAFREYIRGLVRERRQAPREDMISGLIAAEEAGQQLTEEEILTTCTLLLVAGHETTVNLIGNGVLQLLRHPDQLAKLQGDPSLAGDAVEEVLRFDPPVQMNLRIALEDRQFDGVNVEKGTSVVLLIGASNRDPSHFPDPDRFDIIRGDDRHLSFGFGSHFCLGAPLARLEGEIALRTLTQRFRGFALPKETPPYRENIVLRGLASLPITFSAA